MHIATVIEMQDQEYAVEYSYTPAELGVYHLQPEHCRPYEAAEINNLIAYDSDGEQVSDYIIRTIMCDYQAELIQAAKDQIEEHNTNIAIADYEYSLSNRG